MATVTPSPPPSLPFPADWKLSDLLAALGDVPPSRVRLVPFPGTATEQDLLALDNHQDIICELIDGVLVEKAMGYIESLLAMAIGDYLREYVVPRDLGIVLGADGTLRILPGMVRIPDVAFVAWERFPNGELPATPIPAVAPDLAVEVLSAGNTRGEMDRKLRDYFAAGTRLVWYVDPATRTATVFTAPDQFTQIDEHGALDGGDVLPGLEIPLRTIFAETARRRPD